LWKRTPAGGIEMSRVVQRMHDRSRRAGAARSSRIGQRQPLRGVDVGRCAATIPRWSPLMTSRASADPIADPTATDNTKMATTTRNMIMTAS
jgi:hypothetical protein